MPIGVYDRGLGGMSVLAELQKELPDQAFCYLSNQQDVANDRIYAQTCVGIQCLFDQGCDLVLLADNTISALALHRIQADWLPKSRRRVLGGFVPVIEHLTQRDWGDNAAPTHTGLSNVGLFAADLALQSNAFAREMKFRARDVTVIGQNCDALIAEIENGALNINAQVQQHVEALLSKIAKPQAVVLGSNHLALYEPIFQHFLPDDIPIVAAPPLVAQATKDYVTRHKEFAETGGVTLLTTGLATEMAGTMTQFLPADAAWQQIILEENNA